MSTAAAVGEPDSHAIAIAAERRWAWVVIAIMALLVAMMTFTGLHWSAMPPSRVETVDVKTGRKMTEDSVSNVLNQEVENAEGIGQPVYDELKAGECSIHSDLTLHGSEANMSMRRRCGLTLRYTPSDVVAGMDWWQKGVVVSGQPVAHWANRPRPETD